MCGLFGWVSNDPKNWTELTKFKFEVLGVENDVRGGDGCGIYYDSTVVKSEVVKKFDDCWRGGNVPETLEHPCIIGHDRKTSVGGNTLSNTQPIIHDGISTVIAHNGTLVNHLELFKKHKIDVEHPDLKTIGMSDSQMLCLLLHYEGWKILDEYIGAAALMVVNYLDPSKLYIYHGRSPMRKHAVADSEERPLYYAIDGDSFWISSTQASLSRIIPDKTKIIEVPFNKVFEVQGTTMREVYSVDRSACYQLEYASNFYEQSFSKKDGACNMSNMMSQSSSTSAKVINLKDDEDVSEVSGFIHYKAGTWKGKAITPGVASEQLDGQVFVSNWAKYLSQSEAAGMGGDSYRVFYFWRGNLCKSRKAYLDCVKTETLLPHLNSSPMLYYINGKNFMFPFIIPTSNYGDAETVYSTKECMEDAFTSREGIKYDLYNVRFSGLYSVPCRRIEFVFANGKLSSKLYSSAPYVTFASNQFNEADDKDWLTFFDEYSDLCEELASKEKGKTVLLPATVQPPAEKLKDEEEEPVFVCPNCKGESPLVKVCEFCGGEGMIPKDLAEEFLNSFLEEDSDKLRDRAEILILQDNLLWMIDSAVDIMEEPNMRDLNENFYELLLRTKTKIEKCLQS